MNLTDFKRLLAENAGQPVRFVLPTGSKVPPQAHVTEVARINKQFIDCGGTLRAENTCRLQTWVADDTDHRLTAGKLLSILNLSAAFLETEDLAVEVEHEAPFIAHFPIEKVTGENGALHVQLGIRHTACLAEDKCLPPTLNRFKSLPQFNQTKCC